MRRFEGDGWVCVRSPASKSAVDFWAMRQAKINYALVEYGRWAPACEIQAVQVKANVGSPYKSFQPKERRELAALAARAGATPMLVHWPPRGECRVLLESDWPPLDRPNKS
jgi:hypothetical protein